MQYLWAEWQRSLPGRNGAHSFRAHHVTAKDSRGIIDFIFRSLFKHHCLRVVRFINSTPGDITTKQMDDAAFNPKYDKPVERGNDRPDYAGDLYIGSGSQLQADDKTSLEKVPTLQDW